MIHLEGDPVANRAANPERTTRCVRAPAHFGAPQRAGRDPASLI